MSIVQTPSGTQQGAAPSGQSNVVTPELAESLPYAELKQRMRAEATAFEEPATPVTQTGGGQSGDEDEDADAASSDSGTEQELEGEQGQQRQSQGTRTTEREYKKPETLEEALRALDAVRGNLTTAASERAALQRQLQEFQAEAARQKQEAERQALASNHQRIVDAIGRLPTQAQRDAAYADYQRKVRELAAGEALQHADTQQEQLARRAFELDKREIPSMYEDIATFVASQHGIKPDALVNFVKSERIANMVKAAQNPTALQAVSVVLGETLDEMATLQAGREAAAKEERRKLRASGTVVRDVPAGTVPGGGNEDEVARINAMSPDDFAAFKKRLLAAQNQ